MPQKTLILDVSNLTVHRTKFVRTGIQEVVYQTLVNAPQIRKKFPDWKVILLPQLPYRAGTALDSPPNYPYMPTPIDILESIEADFLKKNPGSTSEEFWGFDLKSRQYRLTDEEMYHFLAEADLIHIQGMANIGPILAKLDDYRRKRRKVSMTIYDLIPEFFPEYCDNSLARWFQTDFLRSTSTHADHAICISRHTALDLQSHPMTGKIPKIEAIPLPFEIDKGGVQETSLLKKYGLREKNYLIFLGSLEPRKNFDGLLEGFEHFKKMRPHSSLKLVMVGSTGWKNAMIQKRLGESPAKKDIVRTGYLSDTDLNELMRKATGVAMLSFYEGYGLPIAQALSKGTPCLTTLGSSLPEACGSNGIFVDPSNVYSISSGIELLCRGAGKIPSLPHLAQWTWENYTGLLLESIFHDFPLDHQGVSGAV